VLKLLVAWKYGFQGFARRRTSVHSWRSRSCRRGSSLRWAEGTHWARVPSWPSRLQQLCSLLVQRRFNGAATPFEREALTKTIAVLRADPKDVPVLPH